MDVALAPLARSLEQTPIAQRYRAVFDEIAPFILLALPAGLTLDDYRASPNFAPTMARLIGRRLIAFNVHDGRRAPSRAVAQSNAWKRSVFQDALVQPTTNGSPLKPNRIQELVIRITACIHDMLGNWILRQQGDINVSRALMALAAPKEKTTFVSFSSNDLVGVRRFCDGLQQRGHDLWLYTDHDYVGEPWQQYIDAAMIGSNKMLAFCSRAQSASPHCYREIKLFDFARRPILPIGFSKPAAFGRVKRTLAKTQFLFLDSAPREVGIRRVSAWIARHDAAPIATSAS